MEVFFKTEDIDTSNNEAINLMDKVREKLMIPDVILAMRMGCHFDVNLENNGESVTISLKSKEKVSILKALDGTPISIIIKQ